MGNNDVLIHATAQHVDDECLQDVRITLNGSSADLLHIVSIIVEDIAEHSGKPAALLYGMLALSESAEMEGTMVDFGPIRKALERMRGDGPC